PKEGVGVFLNTPTTGERSKPAGLVAEPKEGVGVFLNTPTTGESKATAGRFAEPKDRGAEGDGAAVVGADAATSGVGVLGGSAAVEGVVDGVTRSVTDQGEAGGQRAEGDQR
ncbi:MAG: hypothetical protein LBV30_02420, partial [Propionibacteriaceae bacterium]|nr:hypothetical protein [Propionibacteriaceae bacterium]